MASAGDYFKAAAAQLRRAIEFKRNELNDLRKALDNIQRDTNKTIEQAKKEMHVKELLIANPDTSNEPSPDKAIITRQLVDLKGHLSDKQREVSQTRDQINDRIQALEREIQGLNQEANAWEMRN